MPQHSIKEEARRIIDHLPEQATYEDLMYELYVKQKIARGQQASREGRVSPHSEVKKRYHGRAN